MGHHKTFADGEKIPTANINYWRDYRQYSSYAEIVAAVAGFGASDRFKRYLCEADGYEYYWNGTELLRIPAAGGGGGSASKGDYSYIIYKSGSDYYAEDDEGNVVYGGSVDAGGVDGADLAAVINAADNALPSYGGRILLSLYGTQSIGTKLDIDRRTKLSGLGRMTTHLQASTNLTHLIEIDPTDGIADWEISDLRLDMNSNNGDAIYCSHTSCYTPTSDYTIVGLNRLLIEGVASGYAGIYLLDPMYIDATQIRVRTSGYGLRFGHSGAQAVSWGNCTFHTIDVIARANNVIGLEVIAGASNNILNLTHWDHYQYYASNKTGCKGIYYEGSPRVVFTLPSVEFGGASDATNDVCCHLKDVIDVEIYNPYFWCGTNGVATTTGLFLEETGGAGAGSQCLRNKIFGGRINIGGSGVSIDDDVSAPDDVGHENIAIATRIYKQPSITSFKYVRCPVWGGAAFAMQDTYT